VDRLMSPRAMGEIESMPQESAVSEPCASQDFPYTRIESKRLFSSCFRRSGQLVCVSQGETEKWG
jgi:hypothetical protein